MSIKINRKSIRFLSEPKRVITRFFFPSPSSRVESILRKVAEMPDEAARLSLTRTLRDFSGRHRNVSKIYRKHFNLVSEILRDSVVDLNSLCENKQLLIGAYFTSEYSIEAAAFFNPSMVEDPDQTGLQMGQKRVIISFRATGEGHISSIVFRGGILDSDNCLTIVPTGVLVEEADAVNNHIYKKADFWEEIREKKIESSVVEIILAKLKDEFDYYELNRIIADIGTGYQLDDEQRNTLQEISWLADAYYEIKFSLDTGMSDRVIFPLTADEKNGIEDARFVKFTDDDGIVKYYAIYTAYNGITIKPRLIETKDFYRFVVSPIHGKNIQNKGMALFPRKINGKYAMLARIDGVNNYVMYSDNINLWGDAIKIQEPKYPWEFIQVGNCGSPIETESGWLVITHGVGTMRKYCLGAMLLDLDDPTIVLGELPEPLLSPNEEEREGYVPNVVYSCGSIINNNELVIPYAMSDTSSTYATVSLDELLNELRPCIPTKSQLLSKKRTRILLVEDEVMNQHMITQILKGAGYDVDVAPDGIVALMKIGKYKFDLILSDISMPNFDGYQLLDFLNVHDIKIPVVFISGRTNETDEIKGLKMGAVEYIHKPIIKDILLLRLDIILKS